MRTKNVATIVKLNERHDSKVMQSDEKFDKLKEKLGATETRLRQQRMEWQQKVNKLDNVMTSKLSTEKIKRREVARRQLDKAVALEEQMQELIDGLNVMNDELTKEVEDAKRAKRVAERKYKA